MNKHWIYVVAIALISACQGKGKTEEKIDNSVKAKITVDHTMQMIDTILLSGTDTAFLVKNKPVKDDMGDKQKDYIVHIYFTNTNWPQLTYKNALGADLFLTGDLDGDQQPELLLRPEWFSSCWASINLFSLKGNMWQPVKSGNMYFCADKYPLAKRIIKTEKGYGLLTDSLTHDKFITIKKEIKF